MDAKGEAEPVPGESLEDQVGAWAESGCMTDPRRIVARTVIGEKVVSTVFLGIDNQLFFSGVPLVWETAVLGADGDVVVVARYSTRQQALDGHHATVRDLREDIAILGEFHVEGGG
jgi:hypothetical protein